MTKIRHNHPDLKGSFTCLGCWFNLENKESMEKCYNMINEQSGGDRNMAKKEIRIAKKAMGHWMPKPHLQFLYDAYSRQN